MPSDFAFRLSTYLTLALSCACLGYSEWDLLPESGVLAVVVLVLLAVSFQSGSRYELDLQSANRVGLVIGFLAAAWLAYQFVNKNSLIYTLPWPASLLPYLGPLLMVLMPAKLFRPKHVGDWWAMQGIALAGVGLASSMAEDEVFGVLLGFYAVAAVTSLSLFFYRRAAGTLPPVPHTVPDPVPVVAAHAGHSGRVVWRAVGWLALAVGVGLPLFFLTPRSQAPKWQYGKTQEVGLSSEQMADLTRTGDLAESRDVAFHVRALYPDGRPKDDLNPNQRWRAYSLNYYEGGRWTAAPGARVHGDVMPLLLTRVTNTQSLDPGFGDFTPPDLGPDQYRLEFMSRDRSGTPVLSDPVAWEAEKPSPVASVMVDKFQSWYQFPDGSFRPRPTGTVPSHYLQYVQVTRPSPSGDPGLGPPFELRRREPLHEEDPDRVPAPLHDPAGPLAPYRRIHLPKLQFWTRDLLERLAVVDPSVRASLGRANPHRNFQIAPEDYEPIARALCAHLARSGEYQYTLKLRREDTSADPVEEFLYRSRVGHCQRFAAGLALMLRSVGIPASYVLGFKGCEAEGDGNYVIRQNRAHAWVEVLVVRPTPPGFHSRRKAADGPAVVCHWLSLDPSPDADVAETDSGLTGWLGAARETGAAFFKDFIVGYNQDRRDATVATARDWLIRGGWAVVGILSVIAGTLLFRPGLRRRRTRRVAGTWTTGYEWFDRMTRILTAGGYPVAPGATPREYAEATSAALAGRPETTEVADVPLTITRAFYLGRYGGRPPVGAEFARMTEDLDRLQTALGAAPVVRSEATP
jgi:hypothetical protein